MTIRSIPLATSTKLAASSKRVRTSPFPRERCMNLLLQVTANAAMTVGTSTERSLPMKSTSVSSATIHLRNSDCLVSDTRCPIHVSDANWPQRNATTLSATSAQRSGGDRRARDRNARLAPSVEHPSVWSSLRRAFMPTDPQKR
jgi:hypothetical protein